MLLVALALLLIGASPASEVPTLRLPATEAPDVWASAAELGGVRLVTEGPADITLRKGAEGWQLVVVDRQGERLATPVGAPVTELHREELVYLARSLVDPVEGPDAPDPEATDAAPADALSLTDDPASTDEVEGRRLSAGVTVGLPTGLTALLALDDAGRWAVELRVGLPEPRSVWVQANALLSPGRLGRLGDRAELRWTVGVGAVLALAVPDEDASGGPWIGPRVPVGLSLGVRRAEVFADIAPTWIVGQSERLRLPVAAGVRLAL